MPETPITSAAFLAAWPAVPGFDLAAASVAAEDAGGDYHDFLLPAGRSAADGEVAVVVGDAAGHDGVASGLMAQVRGALRAQPARAGDLGAVMARLNRTLAGRAKAGRFMTLFLAVLVAEARCIHWVSAGHAPVLAYNPESDRFADVGGEDIPLGIDPDWRFHELSHTGWPAGALLVVGTDGVTEARDPAGEEYGRDRLCAAVRQAAAAPAAGIIRAVAVDHATFRRGRRLHDDATLVVVKAV